MVLTELKSKIEERSAVIGVIGLGYVGLPVAGMFARAGFRVIGIDIKADRIETIQAGLSPIEGDEPGLAELLAETVRAGRLSATTNYAALQQADVILIDVETPVEIDRMPRYKALKGACTHLRAVLKSGALVIVESTIAPLTCDGVVRPMLEETGKHLNIDFYLGACPERVMPGKLLKNLRTLSRVCGGSTPETAQAMIALYGTIVEAELDATDCVTAELVKTAENAFRDVSIAFANELALACEATGGDFLRVRELVNKSPGRNVLLAGAGVGGHCIPKDSWLLAHGVNGRVPVQLITSARAVNDYMPLHVLKLVERELRRAVVDIEGARIAVLGYTYLEDSDDTRNSPSAVLIAHLEESGAEVMIHDPWVAHLEGDVYERVRACDAVIVMVAHSAYRDLNLEQMAAVLRTPILIDGRRVFEAAQARAAGLTYRAIGLGEWGV
jgi:UDP-N-acetyl-D-mannosaminuronic acid dehydrogenase